MFLENPFLIINMYNMSLLQVTFDKNILTRSVTLAGEVFDPSGTLTGGMYICLSALECVCM